MSATKTNGETVWESFVGSETPAHFLALVDEEVRQGKHLDREAAFFEYANFALTNLCVSPERQVLYNDGWTVAKLAAELRRHAEGS